VIEQGLRGVVLRPSELNSGEITLWQQMLAQSRSLQRAFFTHGFAHACERASGRAYVAVLHEGSNIRGFLPFQFRSAWHARLRLAERIGGNFSDAAGVIAWPGLKIDSAPLMRLAGLNTMFLTHLVEDQAQIGLDAEWSNMGYMTDIGAGPEPYFAAMAKTHRDLMRDTERRLRRAEKLYGKLRYVRLERVSPTQIADVIHQKRLQYARTHVADPFADANNLRLIGALAETSTDECRLILTRLEAGERVLAQHLGPQCHDVLSYWFPVYDPAARDVSPGRLLLWHTISQADVDGVRLIDRGEGDAPYKRELATGTARYGRANWTRGSARSLPARAWQSLEWRMQIWRRRHQTEVAGQRSS
jgi:CelD/BcsL family acetyltransferase involved in cellulose biosynthesis